jgi:sugar lactone lactonase YvrE
MNTATRLPRLLFLGIVLILLAAPVHAAAGDTVADRVLGQRRLSTSLPFFVDGRVFSATDVAVDRSVIPNRIYLADAGLNRVLGWSDIRRFRAGESADLVLGQRSLFLGAYVNSAQNCPEPPSATNFCWPNRVAVDHRGNLYVVDAFNGRVLEFDSPFTTDRVADRVFGPTDFTSRVNPRNPAWSAPSYFEGLSVDGAGNVWMVDPTGTRRVLEFDDPLTHDTRPDRVIEPGTEQECFHNPRPQNRPCDPNDVEVSPQGDLYVQDFELSSFGGPSLMIFRQPLATDLAPDVVLSGYGQMGVVFDPAGNLYTVGGLYVSRVPAPIGSGSVAQTVAGPFRNEIYTGRPDRDSDGNLYTAGTPWPERENGRVYVLDAPFQGQPFALGRGPLPDRDLRRPTLVAVDRSASPNRLYVVDAHNRVLGWRDAAGFTNGAPADLILEGDGPNRPGTCNFAGTVPSASQLCLIDPNILGGLAVDSHGNLWISDVLNHRVLKFDRPFETDAVADRVLGQGGSFTTGTCNKGGRTARSLCYPGALAFDSRDNLYVADQYNNRVLLFLDPAKDPVADKIFGQGRSSSFQPRADSFLFGYEDGSINVHFYAGSGLAVDPEGNLFVADSANARVLIFKDAARSDTLPDAVLGQDNFRTWQPGTGPRRFGGRAADYPVVFGPTGLAISPEGDLYVADSSNDRLLVFEDPLRDTTADRVFGHSDFGAGGTAPLHDKVPPASASRLLRPIGLAFDALGNLYVADTEYNRVLAFDRP